MPKLVNMRIPRATHGEIELAQAVKSPSQTRAVAASILIKNPVTKTWSSKRSSSPAR